MLSKGLPLPWHPGTLPAGPLAPAGQAGAGPAEGLLGTSRPGCRLPGMCPPTPATQTPISSSEAPWEGMGQGRRQRRAGQLVRRLGASMPFRGVRPPPRSKTCLGWGEPPRGILQPRAQWEATSFPPELGPARLVVPGDKGISQGQGQCGGGHPRPVRAAHRQRGVGGHSGLEPQTQKPCPGPGGPTSRAAHPQ